MRREGWREHVRAELQAREGRLRGLRRLLERNQQLREQLEAQRTDGGASGSPAEPAGLPEQLRREEGEEQQQQVALLTELLRSAEAENREQRARLGCLARDLAVLTRQHQEAECRAWTAGREQEELRAELSQSRALLRETQAGRLALETRWLREKALEATRLNRAIEQEEKYRRKVSHLQEKLAKARGQAGQPDVESDGRGGRGGNLSTSSQEEEASGCCFFALKRGGAAAGSPLRDRRGSRRHRSPREELKSRCSSSCWFGNRRAGKTLLLQGGATTKKGVSLPCPVAQNASRLRRPRLELRLLSRNAPRALQKPLPNPLFLFYSPGK